MIFYFFFTIFLILKINSQQCPSYTCTTLLDSTLCEKRLTKNLFLVQECPHNFFCPFKDDKDSITCRPSEANLSPAYPGGYCQDNRDCLQQKCFNNTCIGQDAGEICNASSQCNFGLVCLNKICTALKTKGLQCNSDEECVKNLGCFNKICIDYFSLQDGVDIPPNQSAFFCKSGYTVNNKCTSLKNIDTNLSNCDLNFPCNYTDLNEMPIQLNSCECGYNRDSISSCMLGTQNNTDFSIYINHIKNIVNLPYDKCNAEESHFNYCRESLRNNWDVKKKKIELQKNEIWAMNTHKLKNSDFCISKVVFGYDDTPPMPRDDKFQCPIFKCEKSEFTDKSNQCAYSTNPFNEFGSNVTVYLNNICGKDEECDFLYKSDLIYKNWTSEFHCKKLHPSELSRLRLPGESCTSHDDCQKGKLPEIGFCIDGFCNGRFENQNCTSHSECVTGTFCNGIRCERQKKEKEFCIDFYHCQNHLGCLNNTCVSLYSQKNGTFLNERSLNSSLCEYNLIRDGRCAQLTYKNHTLSNDGFTRCTKGEKCYYTTGYLDVNGQNDTFVKECECGFNQNGESYCPLPHSYHTSDWKNLYKQNAKLLMNTCHTLTRDQCDEMYSIEQLKEENRLRRLTNYAHIFYKSPQCVIDTLSSKFLSISMNFVILITLINLLS